MVLSTHGVGCASLPTPGKHSWTRYFIVSVAVLTVFFSTSLVVSANTYIVSVLGDSGVGSMRQAIMDANSNPGLDTIIFNISGPGPFNISPGVELPAITDVVLIDGSSELTFNPAACSSSPCVFIDGAGIANTESLGLDLQAGGSTVKGLAIGNFGKAGINIASDNNIIQGNHLGTDISGTVARRNGLGVLVLGPYTNNLIGGTTAAARNIVSGNYEGVSINRGFGNTVVGNYIGTTRNGMSALANSRGVELVFGAHNNIVGGATNTTPWSTCTGACNLISGNDGIGVFIAIEFPGQPSENNVVQGNYVGTNVTGTSAIPNWKGMEVIDSRNNLIGGPNAGEGNLISGNNLPVVPSGSRGITITGNNNSLTYGNVIQGNRIGTTANGLAPLGNASDGVLIWDGAFGNTVGGVTGTTTGACTGACNLIAFNGTFSLINVGVRIYQPDNVTGTVGNLISRNSIYSNPYGGIDLGLDGSTADDSGDQDAGPNQLQNRPAITSAAGTVQGTLNSTPNRTFVIELFSDPAQSNQQGRTLRGSVNVTTNASGNAGFNVVVTGLIAGHYLTATATDVTTNDTSEFSVPFRINTPTAANVSVSGQILTAAGNALGGVTVELAGSNSLTTITNRFGYYSFIGLAPGAAYTITPARSNYHFSPSIRTLSLVGNETNAIFTASADAINTSNPLDTNYFFVRQQYLDFLDREPDHDGLEYWGRRLGECDDAGCVNAQRVAVSAAFFIEAELQRTGSFVYRLYRGGLGRSLSFAEFIVDRRSLGGRQDLEVARLALANSFVQRAEFVRKYEHETTAGRFVDALLQNLSSTSRVNLSAHRDELIDLYLTGTSFNESRSRVLVHAIDFDTFKQAEYNRSFVMMEYFGYLQRDPDQDGLDFWLEALNNRRPGNYTGMVCAFITSSEYQLRFSNFVSHGNIECDRR